MARAPSDAIGPRTPVLVLGGKNATTLAVIRALGRKGIPLTVVGAERSFVSRSRWYRAAEGASNAEPTAAWLQAYLGRAPSGRMAVIPCGDAWVSALAELEPGLADRFPVSLAPRPTLDVVLDKGRFAEAMARFGIPHPRTTPIDSADDLTAFPDSAFASLFLKPRVSWEFQRRYGVKGFLCATRAEAIERVQEARRAGLALVLQELIPGPTTAHYFLEGFMDRHGTISVCIASQRLRMHPPQLADGCFGMSITPQTIGAAVETLTLMLRRLHYRGVFAVEFKLDARDHLFKIIELNPRVWAYVSFATACGADVVEMAYRDALDLPVAPVPSYRTGRCYLDPYPDLRAGWRLIRAGQLTPGRWLWSWVGATQAVACADDPVPAVIHYLGVARGAWQRRAARLMARP
jgi:predicted ATP-grasp superfamily ATP-dependent carboligase